MPRGVSGGIFFLVLILLVIWSPAQSQNKADLTIQGTMPAVQRVNIASVRAVENTNLIEVTLQGESNIGESYLVTLQSAILTASPNSAPGKISLLQKTKPLSLVAGQGVFHSKLTAEMAGHLFRQIPEADMHSNTLILTITGQ